MLKVLPPQGCSIQRFKRSLVPTSSKLAELDMTSEDFQMPNFCLENTRSSSIRSYFLGEFKEAAKG